MRATRRAMLKAGAATGVFGAFLPSGMPAAAAAARTQADESLHALLSRHLQEELLHAPQKLTLLGLDTGRLA